MRNMMTLGAVVALLAAPVQAACWTKDEASAAGLRQLQSMLMVTALRCEAGGTRMMGDYNAFVTANRGAIGAENDRLRAHFIHALGAVAGQNAYDSFTTSMANGFGAGAGAPATCQDAIDLAHEAGGMAGSRDGLMLLVDRLAIEARLPEGRCEARPPVTMASAAPLTNPVYADASRYAGSAIPTPVSYSPGEMADPR